MPTETLLVKGAWASASDSSTPVPEGGILSNSKYENKYFRLTYSLPDGWMQKYSGPPPSDTGYYVLAQFRRGDAQPTDAKPADSKASFTSAVPSKGSILIAAQDLFFALTPATNTIELINATEAQLAADYKVERAATPVSLAGHAFMRFDYFSPAAELHWYVLATEIRCHAVKFVLTSRDTLLLESLVAGLDKMQLPADASAIGGNGGEDAPVCVKHYASGENVIERVDPVFTERKYNAIPVRIVIGKDGKVKHIHFLSAFPEQAKSISDALWQWRFKPYFRDGQPVEVETGILFGHAPPLATAAAQATSQ